MNFDQKLNALMHLFKISNSKLARGIGVDASLVSRWKSGERKISPNSPHIPMLASFFLKLNAYHYQKEYLDKIIAARLSSGQSADEANRVHILADWLISEEPAEPQPDEQPEQLAQSVSLISNISSLLTNGGQLSAKLPPLGLPISGEQKVDADWQPMIVPGRTNTYEVFEGRTGRRQAALNLFYQVLQSAEPLEIYMTSEDDTRWLTEDSSFTALWARLLRQIIEKGHRITIIHVLSRRVNEIMSMLSYWMPLHMAGRMNSFHYPRFGDRRIRQTYLIIRGKSALVSSTIADFSGNDLTYRYDDPLTVEQQLRLFNVHLSQCRPLFTIFGRDNVKAYFEYNSDMNRKNGANNSIRHQLNIRMLPPEVLRPYLVDDSNGNANPEIFDWLAVQQQEFFHRLEQETSVDILPLSLLDSIRDNGTCKLPCCEIFSDQPIYLSEADTIIWLRKTVEALLRYPNYELYLCAEHSPIENLRINITYKENVSATFSPSEPQSQLKSIVALNEANILHSLSYYFDDQVQQIPANLRNRSEVIIRLERLIAILSGQPTDIGL